MQSQVEAKPDCAACATEIPLHTPLLYFDGILVGCVERINEVVKFHGGALHALY